MLFRNVIYLVFLNQGLSLSRNSPRRLGQLSSDFLSQLPSTVDKSMCHHSQLLHVASGNWSHLCTLAQHMLHRPSLLPSPRGGILEQWSHFYLCCDFYLFCPLMWWYSNVTKRSLVQSSETWSFIASWSWVAAPPCRLLSFDYLFIFILLQNMTAYPLVAAGQRKPGKSRDNLDSPVLYKQALTNISEGSSQFQNFKKRR